MTTDADRTERIAEALNMTAEVRARTWYGDGFSRVYVSRQLSRGCQEMGYVELDEDEEITCLPSRRRSWIKRIAESA